MQWLVLCMKVKVPLLKGRDLDPSLYLLRVLEKNGKAGNASGNNFLSTLGTQSPPTPCQPSLVTWTVGEMCVTTESTGDDFEDSIDKVGRIRLRSV